MRLKRGVGVRHSEAAVLFPVIGRGPARGGGHLISRCYTPAWRQGSQDPGPQGASGPEHREHPEHAKLSWVYRRPHRATLGALHGQLNIDRTLYI